MNVLKRSQFTLLIPHEGKVWLYHTLNRALARIGLPLAQIVESLPEMPASQAVCQKLQQLESQGFLVDVQVDERREALAFDTQARASQGYLNLALLTTYECNFNCRYCIEGEPQEGIKRHCRMSSETAQHAIEWIEARVQQREIRRLFLVFYGGEPTLHPQPMETIAKQLACFSQKKHFTFGFAIVTNGSRLTSQIVGCLRPFGLCGVKVTLDGDREAHDRYRPSLGGQGTFDCIARNLDQVMRKIPISLGVNVDTGNLESVLKLADWLETRGWKEQLQSLSIYPIMPRLESATGASTMASAHGMSCQEIPSKELLQRILLLEDELRHRGFPVPIRLKHTVCGMRQDGGLIVIDPEGQLYTCPAFVGRKSFSVGHLANCELGEQHQAFVGQPLPEDCLNCGYLPVCGGGCRYHAQVCRDDWRACVCPRNTLEWTIPEMVKHRLRWQDIPGTPSSEGQKGGTSWISS